jgi:hypothetical protein
VEKATVKDWVYYECLIVASEENTGRIFREYKQSGVWRQQYKTWAAACVPLGKSRSQVDRIIQDESTSSALCAESSYKQDKKESESLKQVEEARKASDPTKTEEEEQEEPEKPAVHSADEPVNPDHTKARTPKENGVPKYQLPVWNQLETTFGRSLNVADELNRKCPCPVKHAMFIHQTKMAMETLNQWRESVK